MEVFDLYIPPEIVNIIQGYCDDLVALEKHTRVFPKIKRELNHKYFDTYDIHTPGNRIEKLVSCPKCRIWTTNTIPVCWCDWEIEEPK